MCLKNIGLYWNLTFMLCSLNGILTENPCEAQKHTRFPGYIGRLTEKCNTTNIEICHHYLEPAWYVMGDFSNIINSCPSNDCGTNFPAWIKGGLPTAVDGIVNRTACVKIDSDCCKYNVTVRIKKCTDFYVYFLVQLKECPSSYCFDSKLPCEQTTTSTTPTTTTTAPTKAPDSLNNLYLIPILVVLSVLVLGLCVLVVVLYKKSRGCPWTKSSKKNMIKQCPSDVPPTYEEIYVTAK